jgi:hypothetical protein
MEVDTILGAQDHVGHLDRQLGGIQTELKAEQTEGCDHLHLFMANNSWSKQHKEAWDHGMSRVMKFSAVSGQ